MVKLSDAQLDVLSSATARNDGVAVAPTKMSRTAFAKVGAALITRALMRETKARPGMPVWRKGKDGCPVCLVITPAGREAIGVDEHQGPSGGDSSLKNKLRPKIVARERKVAGGNAALTAPETKSPRAGSKQALVIAMLEDKSGATLEAMVDATGWQPHTTRAALTGLRKRGFMIERFREGEASVYRIAKIAAGA